MRLSHFVICAAILPLSACATVDLADMTPAAKQTVQPVHENVVIRATEALTAKFTQAGWSEPVDPDRFKKAANFLLRGISSLEVDTDISYAEKAKSLTVVRSDISVATAEVSKVVKAAEVYLDMASEEDDLREELKSLEKAMSSCRKSELMFKRALENVGVEKTDAELQNAELAMNALRDVTNIYGERVRAQRTSLFEFTS